MDNQIIAPIIYPSSAEFWKGGFPTHYNYAFNQRLLTDVPAFYKITSADAQDVAERLELSFPLWLFPCDANPSHTGKFYNTRCQNTPLPPNSFFKIPNLNIYVACPELTFIQAARHLDFISLVQLGFDLCSQYYSDYKAEYGQSSRTIVTTPEQIIAYAKDSNNMHGSAKAIRAAKYVLDSSNSPMETKLAIILVLPIRLGGFGLSGIEMNGGIELSKRGQLLMGVIDIRGDLVWRRKKLAVEYNSKLAHNNDAAYYNDSNRHTALKDSGWNYIGVTPRNLRTFDALEELAGIIRKQLGLPAKKELLAAYEDKRRDVYYQLFKL